MTRYMTKWMGAVVMSSALALTACGEPSEADGAEKTEEARTPDLSGGKADSASGIFYRGELGFGEESAHADEFTGRGEFHAYEIELAADAPITLEITQKGSSRGMDTILYVFGPKNEGGVYDTIVAFDDDLGWGLLSRVRDFAPPTQGTYLVIVGTYTGRQAGNYRLMATCQDGDACAPRAEDPMSELCVFGESYGDLFGEADAITVRAQRELTRDATLTSLERDQIVAAVGATDEGVSTLDAAFDNVDAGVINQVHLWDASARRAFIAYEFGAGDNSYGMILESNSTTPAALILDGDLYECSATWGQERRACSQSDECAAGLRCEGVRDGQGACLDPSLATEGEGEPCATSLDCPGEGLVCAGEAGGFGSICVPAWMRRTFAVEPNLTIPDGDPAGAAVELDTFGLATVHTDVVADLWISHSAPGEVRVTLTNPTGTEAVVFEGSSVSREIYLDDVALVGFPGDEDANGTWTLRAVDTASGNEGVIRSFSLTVTSRWD